MDQLERFRGSLLGLAVGDALGTTLEFRPPGTFTPIDDMIGGGPFDLEPGEWTDDTSMANLQEPHMAKAESRNCGVRDSRSAPSSPITRIACMSNPTLCSCLIIEIWLVFV